MFAISSFLPLRVFKIFIVLPLFIIGGCADNGEFLFLEPLPDPALTAGGNPCVNFDNSTNTGDDLLTALASQSQGQRFYEYLMGMASVDPDMYRHLGGERPFAILVPTNGAVEAFEKDFEDVELTTNQFFSMVKHHIMITPVTFENLEGGAIGMMNRELLNYTRDDNDCVIFQDRATLIRADDVCENGVIHFIDAVLIPSKNFIE